MPRSAENSQGSQQAGVNAFVLHRRQWRRWLRQIAPSLNLGFSLFVHIFVILMMMDVILWEKRQPDNDLVIKVDIRKFEEPAPEPPPPPEPERDIAVSETKEPEPEMPIEKPEPEPEPEPEEPMKFPKEDPVLITRLMKLGIDEGAEKVIGLKPTPEQGTTEVAKVNIFQGRSADGKKAAVLSGDASNASENAVKIGLNWLTRHQNRGGEWSTWRFGLVCPGGDKCRRPSTGTDARNLDPATTGLALLCFLGAGKTHREGEYRNTVWKGLKYLMTDQDEEGAYGQRHNTLMYNHSIATFAIAEAYAMTHDERLKDSLRKAVLFINISQQPGGGWDYTQAVTGRNDTSISGWVVMALKSAAAGGIAIPWETVFGAVQNFDQMTEKSGEVIYANRDLGQGRKGVGMVAVGMLCRQFLGWPRTDPLFDRQARLMMKELPSWKALQSMSFNTMYYWYYATLALYQHGGATWKTWNANLRDMLCEKQRRDGHANGSWDPDGRWFGKVGGRVYSTTMAILSLEVYYRYLPIYQYNGGSFRAEEVLLEAFRKGTKQQRLQALKLFSQFGTDLVSNIFKEALQDDDAFVRLFAAEELIRQGDHAGLPVLNSMLENPNGFIRSKAISLLARINDPILVPGLARSLTDDLPFVAEKASLLLAKITGQDYGFRASDSMAKKREVGRRYITWWRNHATSLAETPEIKEKKNKGIAGKVLVVRVDAGLVMLDIGERNGVKKYAQYYVYRDGEFISVVEVTRILGDRMSSARILEAYTVKKIQRGDRVTSELKK